MNDKQIEERNELFDSAVREKMTGFEPQVPHALWNRIASELDKGEASEETTPIAEHHEVKTSGRWKMAIAAAVLLTLTVGTLLYTINSPTGVNVSAAPMAKAPIVSQPAAAAPVQVTQTKMVATSAPAMKKEVKASTDTKAELVTPTAPAIENSAAKQEATAQNDNLESAPVTTHNNPVELGTIPMASLDFRTASASNDEITVIRSAEKKKKHGRKGDDESTKVILIGKKFDSQPDIRYQIPVRF